MVRLMPSIASTDVRVADWIAPTCAEISSVAFDVWLASALDLGRDDREPASCFACAGRFDGCVEGEQVGLRGDLADQLDHVADFLRGQAPGSGLPRWSRSPG